jgi:hypothetical protein
MVTDMSAKKPAKVYVEGVSNSDHDMNRRAVLLFLYDGKSARIEMPVAKPQSDQETQEEICRRELHSLMDALVRMSKIDRKVYPLPIEF